MRFLDRIEEPRRISFERTEDKVANMAHSGPSHCQRCGARLAADNRDGRCAPCQAADRGRVAQAPDVPPEFWHYGALQEAFRSRHLGRVIRAYRRHPHHGRYPLTQQLVAGWVGLTQAQLSRIESGSAVVHLDRLIQWAYVLGIPSPYLWFKLPGDSSETRETEEVQRRQFLAGASAGAAARNADASTAWELMGEARAASRLLGTDHADVYAIFGPTNVAIHGVQVAVELRNGRDAVRRSYQVDPDRLPASLVERRGQFLIDVAHCHVLNGDDATAVTTFVRAEQIAPQEVRLNREVHHLTRIMLGRERTGAAPGLRGLATRLGIAD
jgi:transcriptional regulator with XRE-family HTH domain